MLIPQRYYFSQITILIVLLIAIFIILTSTIWQIHLNQHVEEQFNIKIATLLINDITAKMYLNQKELVKDPSNAYLSNYSKNLIKQNADPNCYYEYNGCEPLTIAANDLLYWQQAINRNLPHGKGKIFWSKDHNNIIIKISWKFLNHKKQRSFITNSIPSYAKH
jgi:hypothetical protein